MLLEGVKDILIFPWMSKIIKMSGTPELGRKQTFMKRSDQEIRQTLYTWHQI